MDAAESSSWAEMKHVLGLAFDAEPTERRRVLEDACGDDAELFGLASAILDEDERPDSGALETPASARLASSVIAGHENTGPSFASPDVLGQYRLGAKLGRGGMGEVYLASREGDYQQRVAVKILHADFGSGTREVDRIRKVVPVDCNGHNAGAALPHHSLGHCGRQREAPRGTAVTAL